MSQCSSAIRIKGLSAIFLDFSSWSQDKDAMALDVIFKFTEGRKNKEGKDKGQNIGTSPLSRKTRKSPNAPTPALPPPYFYLCLICQNWVS